jgi:hypothetical protein
MGLENKLDRVKAMMGKGFGKGLLKGFGWGFILGGTGMLLYDVHNGLDAKMNDFEIIGEFLLGGFKYGLVGGIAGSIVGAGFGLVLALREKPLWGYYVRSMKLCPFHRSECTYSRGDLMETECTLEGGPKITNHVCHSYIEYSAPEKPEEPEHQP